MTALQANLDAYGRYSAARRLAAVRRAAATTDSDLRLVDREESPTALFGVRAFTAAVTGEFLAAHEAATTVTWTANVPRPDDAPISSPFQTIDERRSEAEKVSELIELIRRSDELPFAKRLAKRLKELVRIAQEEAPDQSEMSSVSMRTLIRLLKDHPDLSEPGVVLTPSGNIRAQWRAAPNKLCAVEFMGDGRVRFVVFAPGTGDPPQTIRVSGIALPVEDFMSAIEPYGADTWMGR